MKLFIRSSACISPQNTFNSQIPLVEVVEYTGTRLTAIEPDYKEFVDVKSLRRMSHIVKMGVATALQCLKDGNTEMPGAIVTGTAFGCLEDTVTFLNRIIEQNEELLPPTAFIQSTHNTVAAQVALMLKCHNYNNTFVHKGISFESEILDAIMLLRENEADDILVGGIDELTDTSFTILTRLGLYRRWPVSNLNLYATESNGSVAGEGSAFFLLTQKASKNNLAELTAIKTLYSPGGYDDIDRKIELFLSERDVKIEDLDLVITGRSGDVRNDIIYNQLKQSLFKQTGLANYKHLCGEYPTSSGFALWLASIILKNQTIPEAIIERPMISAEPKKILIYNHYQKIYHSLMLVSAV